jgi:TorA maturation chaperone TorD
MMTMTSEQKERFCLLAAALLAPPDRLLETDLEQPELRAELKEAVTDWGDPEDLLSPFFTQPGTRPALSLLAEEYDRLFLDPEGEMVSLVESTYKPWLTDATGDAAYNGSKGLLMGDPALHMEDLYRGFSIEASEELSTMPDHLVAELEFLALLFRAGNTEHAAQFVEDHLDWVKALEKEIAGVAVHSFYRKALSLVGLFLTNEVHPEKV